MQFFFSFHSTWKIMKSVQASTHQGHHSFKGKGRQCMTNSLAAILYSYNCKPESWAPTDLDAILQCGDEIYSDMNTEQYLMLDGYYHVLKVSNVLTGSTLRKSSDETYYNLEAALEKNPSHERLKGNSNYRTIFTKLLMCCITPRKLYFYV